jgi:hypothetical protein
LLVEALEKEPLAPASFLGVHPLRPAAAAAAYLKDLHVML